MQGKHESEEVFKGALVGIQDELLLAKEQAPEAAHTREALKRMGEDLGILLAEISR